MRALVVVFLLAGLAFGAYRLFAGGGTSEEAPPAPPPPREDEAKLGRFPVSQFYMERDRFLPATDPQTIPADEATWLRPDDEVFGVVIDGHARAYPVPMISYHHAVNDVIRGIPVAVTY